MTTVVKRYIGPILGIWVLAEIAASILLLLHLDPAQSSLVSNFLLPFEVMIVVPALVYFFIIRKRNLTPLLVLPVSYLGGLVVSYALQPTDLSFVVVFASIMLVVEVSIGVHEFLRVVRRFRSARASSSDPFQWFSEAFTVLIQNRRVTKLMSMELSTMYYALFTWKKKATEMPGVKNFSYHVKSGYSSLIAVLIGASVVEIIAMHILLSQWNPGAALVVTILSLYFIFWLVGDYRATVLRPVKIEGVMLEINSGIRYSVRVPIHMIESIGSKAPEFDKQEILNLGMMGNSDCWIVFREDIEVEGFFGGKQTKRAIGLSLDNTPAFKKAIEQDMAN
ncbi:MAG: hypothetical protein ACOYD7_02015 [Raoultibacter sp.]|jgi:hypothetical protein